MKKQSLILPANLVMNLPTYRLSKKKILSKSLNSHWKKSFVRLFSQSLTARATSLWPVNCLISVTIFWKLFRLTDTEFPSVRFRWRKVLRTENWLYREKPWLRSVRSFREKLRMWYRFHIQRTISCSNLIIPSWYPAWSKVNTSESIRCYPVITRQK